MIDERYFLRNEHHMLDEFKFKNGSVLEKVNVDYGFMGTPKYDDEGNMINAVLFCHGFGGDYTSISDFYQLIGEDAPFSKDDYFFISITSLGSPKSCSPSMTGLKHNFPNYEIEDLINFKRQFLKERFPEIKRINGIIGFSLGGYEALGWSIFHPDDLDFIIQFSSSYKTAGYKYIYAKLANQIIESSPQYYSGVYDESMSNVLITISQLNYLISYSKSHFNSMAVEEIDFMMDNFAENGLFLDIYDIKFLDDFLISYDLESELNKIKCKLLIIAPDNNNYYVPEYDAMPITDVVENSKLIILDVGKKPFELEQIYKIHDEIKEFIESV